MDDDELKRKAYDWLASQKMDHDAERKFWLDWEIREMHRNEFNAAYCCGPWNMAQLDMMAHAGSQSAKKELEERKRKAEEYYARREKEIRAEWEAKSLKRFMEGS